MGAQQSAEEASETTNAAESSTSNSSKRAEGSGASSAEEASTHAIQSSNAVPPINGGQSECTESGSGANANAGGAQLPDAEGGESLGHQDDEEDEDDEEEGCAFCKFMKGGGCKAEFVAWEKCVADSRESGDFVGQCADITEALQACMNRPDNKEYYQLFLDDQEEYVRDQRDKDRAEGDVGADTAGEVQNSDHDSSGPEEQTGKDEADPASTD